jgi:hypothetical protein
MLAADLGLRFAEGDRSCFSFAVVVGIEPIRVSKLLVLAPRSTADPADSKIYGRRWAPL